MVVADKTIRNADKT